MPEFDVALTSVLRGWAAQIPDVSSKMLVPSTLELQTLLDWELQDIARIQALGINRDNVQRTVRERSRLFLSLYPRFAEFCQNQLGVSPLVKPFWQLWLPLAAQIADQRRQLNRPLIQGILGGQGTGKSTLARLLQILLAYWGYHTVCLSLDDLYKTYSERQQLQQQDPRLIWRGPPGTHDLELGLSTLLKLRCAHPNELVMIPRFDKAAHRGAGDRSTPDWVQSVDIVLFEGWFVGVQPIDPTQFGTAPPPILTRADQAFAQDMNTKLWEYLPLWEQLDQLMVLYLQDYQLSKDWRLQAEQRMRATGKPGMSDAEIDQFVEYFWKALHPQLFIEPLVHNSPSPANLVIEIQANHQPGRIYRPGNKPSKSSQSELESEDEG